VRYKGTGLGLAVVQGAVTATGGFIEVESAPAAGTTVALFLPRAPD
jgi:signal transduction histidine kinase